MVCVFDNGSKFSNIRILRYLLANRKPEICKAIMTRARFSKSYSSKDFQSAKNDFTVILLNLQTDLLSYANELL